MRTPPVTPEMRQQFDELGYCVVNDLLDEQTLAAVEADYAQSLDALLTDMHAAGAVASTHAGLPFGRRLSAIIKDGVSWSQHFDISLPQADIRADTPIHTSEAVFKVITHPRLLDAAAAFVGDAVYSNPIQHVRIKPPEHLIPQDKRNGNIARVGWHQDQAVALPEIDQTDVLTVWLAITEATAENGCLCVVPGSHRAGMVPHCPGAGPVGDLQIPTHMIVTDQPPVTVPVRRGGALFMHRLTKHASLKNVSDDIRWSFDLRYQQVGKPTGRPAFPGFVARNPAAPETELRDWRVWSQLWADAREKLADRELAPFNRWAKDQPVCA